MARAAAALRTPRGGAPEGRREKHKAITRAELLAAGRRLFGEKGLYESRIEDLAATAGIAKGTFYLYFESKEALILTVVSGGFRELGARVEKLTAGTSTLEGATARIVEAHVAFFSENPDLMRVFHQMRGMLKFNRREWQPFRRVLEDHLDRLARRLGDVEESQRLSRVRRVQLAALLFGGVSGALSVRVAAAPTLPLPSRMPRLVAAFVGLTCAYAASELRNCSGRKAPPSRPARGTPRR